MTADELSPTTGRAATRMGAATAISRSFGFVRILVVAAVLGTTYLGNAFQASNSFSNVLFELLAAGALSAVLVPSFVAAFDRDDTAGAEWLAGGVLGIALAALGIVTIVAVVCAPWLADVLTVGVDAAVRSAQADLVTFLLRFFVPQILLYAVGAVAIGLLYARGRLAVTAAAPIANSVVIVAAMVVFRVLHGSAVPDLDLTNAERLTLALGGTLGVAAYVAVPLVALHRDRVRLRPRWPGRDPAVGRLLRLSGWAVLQHAEVGLLLGAALVVGNAVEGGVVAYQVAFVFFLAPYAILAQPIHTAVLPELSRLAAVGPATDDVVDEAAFARSVRGALDAITVLIVPVSAIMAALALPAMRVVAFGQATDAGGVGLLAAGLASLAVGLLPYSAFLLFARAYYARGDSRTPAWVALTTAIAGVGVMVIGGALTSGAGRVAMLGVGHTVAYLLGTLILALGLRRTTGHPVVPVALAGVLGIGVVVGVALWGLEQAVAPTGRVGSLVLCAIGALAGLALTVLGLRLMGRRLRVRPAPAASS